jgi:hypothetical protein
VEEQSRSHVTGDKPGLGFRSQIGRGADAVVERSTDGKSVRKRYLVSERDSSRELASREYRALVTAREVLADIPEVTCPAPIDVDVEHGILSMEHSPGDQLDIAITKSATDQRHSLLTLGARLGDAMIGLAERLPADQLDFSVRNTLVSYDPLRLVLLDFTPRPLPDTVPEGTSGIELAIASFLTSTLTYQIRRTTLVNLEHARTLRTIAARSLAQVERRQELDRRRIESMAWFYFWRQSRNRGWLRYLWFHTGGALLFSLLLRRMLRSG